MTAGGPNACFPDPREPEPRADKPPRIAAALAWCLLVTAGSAWAQPGPAGAASADLGAPLADGGVSGALESDGRAARLSAAGKPVAHKEAGAKDPRPYASTPEAAAARAEAGAKSLAPAVAPPEAGSPSAAAGPAASAAGPGEPPPLSGEGVLESPRPFSFLAHRRSVLQAELQALDHGRPSVVPPLLLVSAGVAAAITGAGLGLAAALPCESRCESASAVGFLVVGGITVASAGAVWLQWTRDTQRSLGLRERYLRDRIGFIERALDPARHQR